MTEDISAKAHFHLRIKGKLATEKILGEWSTYFWGNSWKIKASWQQAASSRQKRKDLNLE